MSASVAQISWARRLEGIAPFKLAEVSLIAGVAFAVLNFGGTEPASFAVVEIFLIGIAVIFLARPARAELRLSPRTLLVPGLLLAVVLLQICPLPVSRLQAAAVEILPGAAVRFRSLTIEPFATRTHFLILLTCIIGFFLACIVGEDPPRRRRVIVAIVTIGVFEAFYGLTQYLTGSQTIFGYVKKYDLEEATGTYINRNHYAGFLEMVFPFALAFALREFWKLQRKSAQSLPNVKRMAVPSGVPKFVAWLAIAIVLFVGLICSRSRMGIIAAFLSILVIFALAWLSRFQGKAGILLCAVFLGLSVGLIVWIGAGSVVERFQVVNQEYASRDYSRVSIWRNTLELISQHPWLGTGLGTFPIAYTSVQSNFLGEFVNHAHNDYLELASDLGIPAALALISCFMWFLARAIRTSRAAIDSLDRFLALGCAGSLVAILLHGLADFNLYIPANALLFASILGLTASLQPRRMGSASGAA